MRLKVSVLVHVLSTLSEWMKTTSPSGKICSRKLILALSRRYLLEYLREIWRVWIPRLLSMAAQMSDLGLIPSFPVSEVSNEAVSLDFWIEIISILLFCIPKHKKFSLSKNNYVLLDQQNVCPNINIAKKKRFKEQHEWCHLYKGWIMYNYQHLNRIIFLVFQLNPIVCCYFSI